MALKLIKKFFLTLFVFICISCLLEFYCRFIIKQPYYAFPEGYFINNQFYGYELARNFKGSYSQPEFTISIDTNSDGLRDTEHSRADDHFRILALGDSFTFGVGVELNDTYLSLLERMLNNNKNGKGYSIIKAGVIGYSTYNERVYLEKTGLNYKPNMVMVQFWWDDLGIDHITYLVDTGFLTTGKIKDSAQLRLFLNRYFRSYAFLRRIFTREFKRAVFANKLSIALENEDSLKNKFAITLKEFKKIEAICDENHIACLFILIPAKEFLYNNIGLEKQWEFFCRFLNENKINYIDLMPTFKQAIREGQKPFFNVDPHLNKNGHQLVAQEIFKYMPSSERNFNVYK